VLSACGVADNAASTVVTLASSSGAYLATYFRPAPSGTGAGSRHMAASAETVAAFIDAQTAAERAPAAS
jgi:hypothetical protein